jgi:hypothetical protein
LIRPVGAGAKTAPEILRPLADVNGDAHAVARLWVGDDALVPDFDFVSRIGQDGNDLGRWGSNAVFASLVIFTECEPPCFTFESLEIVTEEGKSGSVSRSYGSWDSGGNPSGSSSPSTFGGYGTFEGAV